MPADATQQASFPNQLREGSTKLVERIPRKPMKKLAMTVSIVLVCGVALATYIRNRVASTTSEEPGMLEVQANSSKPLVVNAGQGALQVGQQEAPSPPPPPPSSPPQFPGSPQPRHPAPEPARSLVGIGFEDLKEFERYLPEGAQVYTYAVGETSLAAAIINADLDGDGREETVLVYNERKPTREEGSLPLTLSVLVREGKNLKVQASTQMLGGELFGLNINGGRTHIAVRDVTGDGPPEIVIVPGTGASIGGWLEVYSFEESTLRQLARIGGHFFRVRSGGKGKPSIITARSRYETARRRYQWTGKTFEEGLKRPPK